MDTSIASRISSVPRFLVPWLCFSAAIGFLLWTIFSSPAQFQQVPVGLGRYLFFLPAGLAAAAAICTLLWFSGAWGITARLSYVSCVLYLGFLKVLGWDFIPWALIVVAAIAFSRTKESAVENRSSLLLLHAMGSLTGLYMAFHLTGFLQPWALFTETVRSLWLLI